MLRVLWRLSYEVTFFILVTTIFIGEEYRCMIVRSRSANKTMRENTDAELLAAARDGNKDAFGQERQEESCQARLQLRENSLRIPWAVCWLWPAMVVALAVVRVSGC